MTLLFIRFFFLILSGSMGYHVGEIVGEPIWGMTFGLGGAAFFIALELGIRQVSVRGLSSVVFGLVLGVIMAKLVADILEILPLSQIYRSVMRVVLTIFFSYLGSVIALRGKDEFNVIIPYVRFRLTDIKEGVVLLDTSAIIDGRITDIYTTNFLVGRLVVPRFVLHELQRLADSSDDIKRERGRRGIEILREMQSNRDIDLRIHDDDFADDTEVDSKLMRLAKILEARICTTDFNLSRTASIQGIQVLNINDLIASVRPVLYTGDEVQINLVKPGKEDNQAVGYLPDGTMVVVTDARNFIGEDVRVKITSILQTHAGRMIFGQLIKDSESDGK